MTARYFSKEHAYYALSLSLKLFLLFLDIVGGSWVLFSRSARAFFLLVCLLVERDRYLYSTRESEDQPLLNQLVSSLLSCFLIRCHDGSVTTVNLRLPSHCCLKHISI
jgi:hypothetical protein